MTKSKAGVLVVFVAVLGGCSGGGVPSVSPLHSMVRAPTPSPSIPSVTPSASSTVVAATPIPGCMPACVPGGLSRPGDLPAGDYTTQHFFGGQLTVTVEDGWSSFEDSTGEFGLAPTDVEGVGVLFWLDAYPIIDPTTKPVPGIDRSVEGTFSWLEANPNLDVSARGQATLGGLPAQSVELKRSAKATNVDPDCPPDGGRPCVGLLGFPQWDASYSQGGPFHLRLIAADVAWGGERHVIYAMTEAANDALYAQVESDAEVLIGSARLPLGVASAP